MHHLPYCIVLMICSNFQILSDYCDIFSIVRVFFFINHMSVLCDHVSVLPTTATHPDSLPTPPHVTHVSTLQLQLPLCVPKQYVQLSRQATLVPPPGVWFTL